jgi:hypothetical protein
MELDRVRLIWPTGEEELFQAVEAKMVTGDGEPYLVLVIPIPPEGHEDEPERDSGAVPEGQ